MIALTAFTAGLLSFLSPCILPTIPIYVGMLASNAKNKWATLFFCLGMIIIFVLMGMTATTFGIFLNTHIQILRAICGILVLFFGLSLLKWINLPWLNNIYQLPTTKQVNKKFQPFIMGLTFAFSWSPCVGPILGSVLMLAASATTVWYGGFLLLMYALGVSLPFIAASFFINEFKTFKNFISKHMENIEYASGWFLIFLAISILSGINLL